MDFLGPYSGRLRRIVLTAMWIGGVVLGIGVVGLVAYIILLLT